MSPVFVRANGLSKTHLLGAEKLFASLSRFHPYDSRFAYINLLGKDSSPIVKAAFKTAKDAGWGVNPNRASLNYWEERLPLDLPKSFSIISGRYFDRNLYKPFLRTMKQNFEVSAGFMKELDAMMKRIEPRIRTVALIHRSGKVAAAGLSATRDGRCFLFCGSVSKPFRGKGLWRQLVAARQMISETQGAAFWITTTTNPRIVDKGDGSIPVIAIKKGSA